jgi:hypothetical protein
MRILLAISFIVLNTLLFAQDTTFIEQRSYSGKLVSVISGADTTYVGYYKNGKIESVRQLTHNRIDGYYKRWYPNGQLMWQKNVLNSLENGKCTYYNKKGKKVAEFIYEKGVITDTLFLKSCGTLLFGKATWYSVVHGGAYKGKDYVAPVNQIYPFMNYPLRLVSIKDTASIPTLADTIETDAYGSFFVCLTKGKYGFFPPESDLKKLLPGQYCPLPQKRSGYAFWNMKAPLKIEKQKAVFFNLHYSSVVNAP